MLLQVPQDPVKNTFSTDTRSWLAMLRLENQYPAPPWYAPKLEIAHTKRRELRATTMTSMVRLAMIVLIPRLDLRFFSIRFFAHFARFILSSLQGFLSLCVRLRLGSSSLTSQRVLAIKPHCFPRPCSPVPRPDRSRLNELPNSWGWISCATSDCNVGCCI